MREIESSITRPGIARVILRAMAMTFHVVKTWLLSLTYTILGQKG